MKNFLKRIQKNRYASIALAIITLIVAAGAIYTFSIYVTFDPSKLHFLSYTDRDEITTNEIKFKRVKLMDITDYCKDAFISTEDKTFYKNIGVDFNGIGRSLINQSGGGSTISQQLIKLSDDAIYERTLNNKISEIIEAVKLNQVWSKEQIYETYLNNIYLGNYNYGIRSASNDYFGEEPEALDLAECAFMAGLTQAPEVYNPYKNKEAGLLRQKEILNLMVRNGFIEEDQKEGAENEELAFKVVETEAGD